MIITILEANVTSERWEVIEQAFRTGIRHIPTQLLQTFLIQDTQRPNLWRIITVWQSKEAYEEVKGAAIISACTEMFRSAGVEPTRRIFKIHAHHMQV